MTPRWQRRAVWLAVGALIGALVAAHTVLTLRPRCGPPWQPVGHVIATGVRS